MESMTFSTLPRQRRPHLLRNGCLLDYTYLDVLDASTPEELHIASYGCWLAQAYQTPGCDPGRPKTILVTTKPMADIREEINQALFPERTDPEEVPWIFARIMSVGGRVTRRARALILQDLPTTTAIYLSMQGAVAPVLHADTVHGWNGWAFPVMGPSFRVNLLNPMEVANALGGYLMELQPPRAIIDEYGFNPIPEFKRLFETP